MDMWVILGVAHDFFFGINENILLLILFYLREYLIIIFRGFPAIFLYLSILSDNFFEFDGFYVFLILTRFPNDFVEIQLVSGHFLNFYGFSRQFFEI